MGATNLQTTMLADHRQLEGLFERLMEAFNANAREDTQALWTELERKLERHLALEEQHFFPRYSKLDAAEAGALLAEHALIRSRLGELGAGVDLKLVRAEVAKDFLDALKAHATREDAVLYRWAREALAAEADAMRQTLS